MTNIFGTDGGDQLQGGAGADTFFGLAGEDAMTSGGGADRFDGGAGSDLAILSLSALDWAGSVTVSTAFGVELRGGVDQPGAATLAFTGVETVRLTVPGPGGLTVDVAAVNAGLVGGVQSAPVYQDASLAYSIGSPFADVLFGVDGRMSFLAGHGGIDAYVGVGAPGAATFSTVSYRNDALAGGGLGVVADLEAGWSTDGWGNVESLVNIRGLIGTDGVYSGAISDYLQGSRHADGIDGAGGADYLFGRGGDDSLSGGAGADYIDGGEGDDVIYASPSAGEAVDLEAGAFDIVLGGAGNDRIEQGVGRLYAEGGAGNDMILGSSVTLAGAEVAEYLFGDDGADTLLGGDGADALIGSNYHASGDSGQVDALDGGAGADYVLQGLWGRGRLAGGEGADTIVGAGAADTLLGGAGDDFLYGLGGADTFEFALADLSPGGFDVVLDYATGVDGALFRGVAAANVLVTDGVGAAVVSISVAGGVHSIVFQNVTAAEVQAGMQFL